MLIDSHCHLHDREFFSEKQAGEMLKRARKAGVEKIICIGTSHEDSLVARDFASKHENVYWTYGIHPESAGVLSDMSFSGPASPASTSYAGTPAEPSLRDEPVGSVRNIRLSRSNRKMSLKKTLSATPANPVAIGEVGLDYHYEGYNREAQIELFEQMLQLAVDNDLPVSFHVREAFEDFFAVVANFPQVRGMVHSFTDSKKVLRKILETTDFYVGVNGLATYSTLPLPPLERILLETDAPFLAPVPYRGKTNEPAYIKNIAEWLAERLGEPIDKISVATTGNAMELFRLTQDKQRILEIM